MGNITKILCISMAAASIFFSSFSANAQQTAPADAKKPQLLKISGRATLYRFGNVSLANLYGTWQQMGQQYGILFKDKLNKHYTQIVEKQLIEEKKHTTQQLMAIAYPLFNDYPEYLQQFIKAAAKTSGLGEEKMVILNAVEFYFSLTLPTHEEKNEYAGACSGVAAWGDYTTQGNLVFGRNYDFGKFYRQSAADYFAVTVCNPSDNRGPVAFWGYVGCVYAVNGMNASGLFAELNNGERSDPSDLENCTPGPVSILNLLLECTNIDQAERFFNTTRPECGYIINVASPAKAVSFEWATYKTLKRTPNTEGFLVGTNHFKHKDWKDIPSTLDDDNSAIRMRNALAYGQLQKGTFNADTMRDFFDLSIDNGGITLFDFWTSYQFVVTPENKDLWIKVPNKTDWTYVPLGNYLKARQTRKLPA